MRGLYIHIPFCTRRCGYCDFTSFERALASCDDYLAALACEARARCAVPFDTVYIGGGTPSVLSVQQIGRLGRLLNEAADWGPAAERTVEVNPETAAPGTLRAFRDIGMNRVSIGIQSLHDPFLRLLGRRHTAAQAGQACAAARRAGFDSLSIDMIFGLPYQSVADWREDLSAALALTPDHLSLYELTLDQRAPLAGLAPLCDTDRTAMMYDSAVEQLAAAGYERYEVSSFARPGMACRHNMLYWTQQEYVGLGCGAWSYAAGRRFRNADTLARYLRQAYDGARDSDEWEELSADHAQRERLMIGLRMTAGVVCGDAEFSRIADALRPCMEEGLVRRDTGRLRLTSRGMALANQVCLALIP